MKSPRNHFACKRWNTKLSIPKPRSSRTKNRAGAILLDLFLATLLFAGSILLIGQLGTQSLRIATQSQLERLAMHQGLSKLNLEIARASRQRDTIPHDLKIEIVNAGRKKFEIRSQWHSTENPKLEKLEILVFDRNSNAVSSKPLVRLSRYLATEGGT